MRLCILYKILSDHVLGFAHLCAMCIYESVEKYSCFSFHLVAGMMHMKVDPLPTHPQIVQNFGLGKIPGKILSDLSLSSHF